jgi:hypothetical protein
VVAVSASERLKALDAPLPTNLGEWGDEVRKRGAIFLDALPQIVAVVEAAEGFFPEHLAVLQSDLPRALSALEEALT